MRQDFVRRHGIVERQQQKEWELRNGLNRRAWAETRGALDNPIVPRIGAAFSALGLEYGVEMRAPLLDRRVVEFALGRPRSERASMGAVKHLLRRAAEGSLPPSVLRPRPRKTGVLTEYFARSFRADPEGIVTQTFADPILAQLGIVDGEALRAAWRDYRCGSGPERAAGGFMFFALQTELWLRAHTGARSHSNQPEPAPLLSVPAAGFVQ
jgi:asparagine synthetase B (glutamine-hydrolysing)